MTGQSSQSGSSSRLPRWVQGGRRRGEGPSRGEAASRTTAFVYGNILVMAALVALHPEDLARATGVAYVLGTALSTVVAHVAAETVGHQVRTGQRPDRPTVLHMLRDARPILSSATPPALLMAAALFGWLDPTAALLLAMGVIVLRLAGLGWIIGRGRRRRTSWGPVISGLGLAVVCVVAAVLKWWLTH